MTKYIGIEALPDGLFAAMAGNEQVTCHSALEAAQTYNRLALARWGEQATLNPVEGAEEALNDTLTAPVLHCRYCDGLFKLRPTGALFRENQMRGFCSGRCQYAQARRDSRIPPYRG